MRTLPSVLIAFGMILAVVGQTADAGNPTSELDIVTYEKPVDL